MILRTAAFLLATLAGSGAADWQQHLTPPTPGSFPLPRPMRATYRGGWAALSAADLEANFSRRGDAVQLDFKASTTGFVRTLWRIDATHVARAEAATLRPLEMRQLEVYRGKTVRTELDFDGESVTKFRESKPDDKTPTKRKHFEFANLFDLHTALLFVRSQKLRPSDVFNIVVYPATAPYLVTIRVIGREKLQVAAGRYQAIKLDVKLQRIDQNYDLQPHQKFKRATAWLSDDADRLLLKAQADIFVGSIWAELTSAKFAGRTPSGS